MLQGKIEAIFEYGKTYVCIRAPPPPQSRPEAAHFPTQQYTFEDQKRRFYAPQEYPEPPKDMWYSIPDTRPVVEEPPKAIFPWEQQSQRPRTTRIFSDDYPPSPQIDQPQSPPLSTWAENTGGMEKYIRNIMVSMADKAKEQSDSPVSDRRESLIFTGLPAPEDRPSLPVTPAPMMTASFWADDQNRDEEEKSGQPEGLSEPPEWVCPQCGFSSNDPSVFAALPASTSSGLALPDSPAIHHAAAPDNPTSSETITLKSIASPRPEPVQRESSSETSAISGVSTVVSHEDKDTVNSPPQPEQPEPRSEPLSPPAWLTAAIIEDDDEFDEEEPDASTNPDSSSVHASSQELIAY
jgi:glycogenin glucosyltransferase